MFKYLVLIVALLLASVAGYYSVFGLSKLFAGAFVQVLIMASVLEIGKVVSATLLKRYWSQLSKFIRVYLVIGVLVLMLITSGGIYGFLTNAFQLTYTKLSVNNESVKLLELKIDDFKSKIDFIKDNVESKRSRIETLNNIRNQQETRLDSLYAINYISTAKRVERIIANGDGEIKKLSSDIDNYNYSIGNLNDSISTYRKNIIETSNNEVSAELGPLMYISDLTGYSMNVIVNAFVIMIIVVFDPLAIILLVSYNEISMVKKHPNNSYINTSLEDEIESPKEVDTVEEISNDAESDEDFDYFDDIGETNYFDVTYDDEIARKDAENFIDEHLKFYNETKTKTKTKTEKNKSKENNNPMRYSDVRST